LREGSIALALALAACGRSEYEVRVVVPGDVGRAVRVEVAVIGACSDLVVPGEPPPSPILLAAVTDRENPRIGGLAGGRYGLAARAFAENCTVFAAGCADVDVEADGEGTLVVELSEIPPRACEQGESCVDERCAPTAGDGGPGDDGGTREVGVVAELDLDDVVTDIATSGSLAAVAISVGGVALVDVEDPTQPVVLSTVPTEGTAVGVSLGDLLFIADDLAGIHVVSVVDPQSPSVYTLRLGGVLGVAAPPAGEGPEAILVTRAMDVIVYDTSMLSQLDYRGAWGGWYVTDAAWFGNYGVTVSETLAKLDTTPDDPEPIDSRQFGKDLPATALAVTASVAWVALGDQGARAYDLLGLDLPELATAEVTGTVDDIAAAGDVVVVVSSAGLEILDADARPVAPVIATVPVAAPSTVALIDGHALVGSGRRLVVVDLGPGPTR
jgi:hypothetical protein